MAAASVAKDADWEALAQDLDRKSPLEIMDNVRIIFLVCGTS